MPHFSPADPPKICHRILPFLLLAASRNVPPLKTIPTVPILRARCICVYLCSHIGSSSKFAIRCLKFRSRKILTNLIPEMKDFVWKRNWSPFCFCIISISILFCFVFHPHQEIFETPRFPKCSTRQSQWICLYWGGLLWERILDYIFSL